APVVEEVLARHGVERGDDLDAGAGDPLVEPVRPVAEDLDDVGEAGRNAALQALQGLVAEGGGEVEVDAHLRVRGVRREAVDARLSCSGESRGGKAIEYGCDDEGPHGVAFLPHFRANVE